jgi:hypothetical protein
MTLQGDDDMNFRLAFLAAAACVPLCAHAQTTPRSAFLERGQVLASGNQVKTFRLPTTDENNKLTYWDVTIDLGVGKTGKPADNAVVTSVKSPKFSGSDFVAGTYNDTFNSPCTFTTAILDGGRQEVAFNCSFLTGSVVNGPIEGHPFELDLTAAKIGDIPGYRNYSWGLVGFSNGTNWTCFNTNEVISARQIANQIVITNYGKDNIVDCGMTLVRQP